MVPCNYLRAELCASTHLIWRSLSPFAHYSRFKKMWNTHFVQHGTFRCSILTILVNRPAPRARHSLGCRALRDFRTLAQLLAWSDVHYPCLRSTRAFKKFVSSLHLPSRAYRTECVYMSATTPTRLPIPRNNLDSAEWLYPKIIRHQISTTTSLPGHTARSASSS